MIKLADLLREEYGGGKYELPSDHLAGIRVPKGGACCANCNYWNVGAPGEKGHCANKQYQQWAGTSEIPAPPDEYCSDWWEPIKSSKGKK